MFVSSARNDRDEDGRRAFEGHEGLSLEIDIDPFLALAELVRRGTRLRLGGVDRAQPPAFVGLPELVTVCARLVSGESDCVEPVESTGSHGRVLPCVVEHPALGEVVQDEADGKLVDPARRDVLGRERSGVLAEPNAVKFGDRLRNENSVGWSGETGDRLPPLGPSDVDLVVERQIEPFDHPACDRATALLQILQCDLRWTPVRNLFFPPWNVGVFQGPRVGDA